jgi:hypothetical protein
MPEPLNIMNMEVTWQTSTVYHSLIVLFAAIT